MLDFEGRDAPSKHRRKKRTRPDGPRSGGPSCEGRQTSTARAGQPSECRIFRHEGGQPAVAAADVPLPGRDYVQGLPALDIPPQRGPVRSCNPTWRAVGCGCGVKVVPNNCGAEDCQLCAKGPFEKGREAKAKSFLARKRGKRVAPRVFAGLKGRPLLHTVFTIPKQLRARAADRWWWELRALALRRYLKKAWGLDWALASYHPTGEKGQGKRFVPHIDLLWVRHSHVAGTSGWVCPEALALLRWEWARLLGWDGQVNLHHGYVDPYDPARDPKVQHRVQYNQRSFPGWSWWRGQAPRWWGNRPGRPMTCPHCEVEVPEDYDGDWCPSCGCYLAETCPKCGEPYRFLGIVDEPSGQKGPCASEHGPL